MKTAILIILLCLAAAPGAAARRVSIDATDRPAAEVFREIVEQADKNFVYPAELLDSINVSVHMSNAPLRKVLREMFRGTGIDFSIRGRDVSLFRRAAQAPVKYSIDPDTVFIGTADTIQPPVMLEEVVVVSRLEEPATLSPETGAMKITSSDILSAPALMGEPDVIKSLQMQPGVVEGIGGLAGMHVHGGEAHHNLYMLDNVPLYHVNHMGGFFSAFNPDIIRYIDFFKTSVPAKYDGRLSSFVDVRLRNRIPEGHHGTARLGLTSGAFSITGPIGSRTSYLVGIRRSWLDLLSLPVMAIYNSAVSDEEKIKFGYHFMDFNAKVSHSFSPRLSAFVSAYYGDDYLNAKDEWKNLETGIVDEKYHNLFKWGNLVAQAGASYRLSSELNAEATLAFTRYFSSLRNYSFDGFSNDYTVEETKKTSNSISDFIARADFNWNPRHDTDVHFGGGFTGHRFMPSTSASTFTGEGAEIVMRDSTASYGAGEANAYIEADRSFSSRFRVNGGLHLSMFCIDGRIKHGISPRLSAVWHPREQFSLKGAYTRTVQYVSQLSTTSLSLPTDQWIPLAGDLRPQSSDKVAVGAVWQSPTGMYEISAEAYARWIHNIVEYADEYYLRPPTAMWNSRLAVGKGSARGIDFKFSKTAGRFTGFIGYSLAWADRTFKDKNGGHTYPARYDNRHTINISATWKVSDRVQLSAAWTGHSGNRFTLCTQMWSNIGMPGIASYSDYAGQVGEQPLRAPLNNLRLPFNHRLDLSCRVNNRRGYWTFGLYNAYNHRNVIGVRREIKYNTRYMPDGTWQITTVPVFQSISLLPIIPSVSYTWIF